MARRDLLDMLLQGAVWGPLAGGATILLGMATANRDPVRRPRPSLGPDAGCPASSNH